MKKGEKIALIVGGGIALGVGAIALLKSGDESPNFQTFLEKLSEVQTQVQKSQTEMLGQMLNLQALQNVSFAQAITNMSEKLKEGISGMSFNIQMPSITTTLPSITMPEIKMPEITMPEIKMPEIKMPEITMPEIAMPAITFPDIKLPEIIKFPDININVPKDVVDTITGAKDLITDPVGKVLGDISDKMSNLNPFKNVPYLPVSELIASAWSSTSTEDWRNKIRGIG